MVVVVVVAAAHRCENSIPTAAIATASNYKSLRTKKYTQFVYRICYFTRSFVHLVNSNHMLATSENKIIMNHFITKLFRSKI